MPDVRSNVPRWPAEFVHQHGRAKQPIRHEVTEVDVDDCEAPGPVTDEIQSRNSEVVVFEVAGTDVVRGRVDWRAEIDRWLPAKIVMGVGAPRDPNVEPAQAICAITCKEQQVPIT